MNEMTALHNILEKLSIIRSKYHEIDKMKPTDFNVFSILRNETEEVKLHSAFIAELLDPRGSHKFGNKFLDLFLEHMLIHDGNRELFRKDEQFRVTPETYAGEDLGRIDILIIGQQNIIVIENKINAGDQDDQLARYWEVAKRKKSAEEHIHIVYLTLRREPPSDKSMEGMTDEQKNRIILCSYKDHIKSWIEACISNVALIPTIRETLVQYLALIKKLTGQLQEDGEVQEIIKVITESKQNIEAAFNLNSALDDIKNTLLDKLKKDLETLLEARGYILVWSGMVASAGTTNSVNSAEFGVRLHEDDLVYLAFQFYNGSLNGLGWGMGNKKLSRNKSCQNKIWEIMGETFGEGVKSEWWPWYATSLDIVFEDDFANWSACAAPWMAIQDGSMAKKIVELADKVHKAFSYEEKGLDLLKSVQQ